MFYHHFFLLSFDLSLSCKLQLIDLITISDAWPAGQQTILMCFFFLRTISVIKLKKAVAVDRKSSFIFCTQFGAQNAGIGISELPDFKIFWGSMPPDPPRLRGLTTPCSYSQLFFSNQLPTSNFIETPEFNKNIFLHLFLFFLIFLLSYSLLHFNFK